MVSQLVLSEGSGSSAQVELHPCSPILAPEVEGETPTATCL